VGYRVRFYGCVQGIGGVESVPLPQQLHISTQLGSDLTVPTSVNTQKKAFRICSPNECLDSVVGHQLVSNG
jgi:hypothetical protein